MEIIASKRTRYRVFLRRIELFGNECQPFLRDRFVGSGPALSFLASNRGESIPNSTSRVDAAAVASRFGHRRSVVSVVSSGRQINGKANLAIDVCRFLFALLFADCLARDQGTSRRIGCDCSLVD